MSQQKRYLEPIDEQELMRLSDAVNYLDARCKTKLWNEKAETLTQHPAAEMIGQRCYDCLDRDGMPLCVLRCPAVATLQDGQTREVTVLREKGHTGKLIALRLTVEPVYNDQGEITGVIETFRPDTLVPKSTLERAQRNVMIDRLTGLPNRKAMRQAIATWLTEAPGHTLRFGVILLRLENLHEIDQDHGLDAVDKVLRKASEVFKNNCRAYDVVSRWSSDYLIALLAVRDESGLAACANRIAPLIESEVVRAKGESLQAVTAAAWTLAEPDDDPISLVARAESKLPSLEPEAAS